MAARYDRQGSVERDDRLQPDPELREGRAGAGRIALTALGTIAIIALVIYGISHKSPDAGETAAPAASQTAATPAPAPNAPPASASNSKPAQRPNNVADRPSGNTGADQAAQPLQSDRQASQPADQIRAGSQPGQPAGDSARANKGNETTGSAAPTERQPAAPGQR